MEKSSLLDTFTSVSRVMVHIFIARTGVATVSLALKSRSTNIDFGLADQPAENS